MALLGALTTMTMAGCDRSPGRRIGSSRGAGDTLQVDVMGKTVVVPAPEGMVDVMSIAGVRPIPRRSGDLVGTFVPRDSIDRALRQDYRPDMDVMLIIPAGASTIDVKASSFAVLGEQWQRRALLVRTPEIERMGNAFYRWQGGSQEDAPLTVPPGDTLCLDVSSPAPNAWRILLLSRGREGGGVGVACDIRVLVAGRILQMFWNGRSVTRVSEVAEISERAERWARAVLLANR